MVLGEIPPQRPKVRASWRPSGATLGAIWPFFCLNFTLVGIFLVLFFRPMKKERKWSSPGVGGHAIRRCLCMFREGRPRLHLGLHFGALLGPQIITILLVGVYLSMSFFDSRRNSKIFKKRRHQGGITLYWGRPGGMRGGCKSSIRLQIWLTRLTEARFNTAGARRGRAVLSPQSGSHGAPLGVYVHANNNARCGIYIYICVICTLPDF